MASMTSPRVQPASQSPSSTPTSPSSSNSTSLSCPTTTTTPIASTTSTSSSSRSTSPTPPTPSSASSSLSAFSSVASTTTTTTASSSSSSSPSPSPHSQGLEDSGSYVPPSSEWTLVKLNVGGSRFITTRSTIFSRGENFLTAMLLNDEAGHVAVVRDDDGYIFIDRNGEAFSVVLDFLRTGTLLLKNHPSCSIDQLLHEFDFYQIDIPYERPMAITSTKLYRHSNAIQWKDEAHKWVTDNRSFLEEIMVAVTNQGAFECSLNLTTTTEHLHRISVLSAPDGVIQLTGPGTRSTSPLPTHITYNFRNNVFWKFVQQYVDKVFGECLHLVFHDTPPSLFLNWEPAFAQFT